jgi:hypothetical protein
MTASQQDSTAMLAAVETADRLIRTAWGTRPGNRTRSWQRQSGLLVFPGHGPDGAWGTRAHVMVWDPVEGESTAVRVWSSTWREAIETALEAALMLGR